MTRGARNVRWWPKLQESHFQATWLQESGFPDAPTALATVAPVRILLVSWEYPPVIVGGLGRHVEALGRELAVAGHDVVVLSRRPTGTDATTHPTALEGDGPLRVLRIAEDPPLLEFGRDLVAWTLAWQHAAVLSLIHI